MNLGSDSTVHQTLRCSLTIVVLRDEPCYEHCLWYGNDAFLVKVYPARTLFHQYTIELHDLCARSPSETKSHNFAYDFLPGPVVTDRRP